MKTLLESIKNSLNESIEITPKLVLDSISNLKKLTSRDKKDIKEIAQKIDDAIKSFEEMEEDETTIQDWMHSDMVDNFSDDDYDEDLIKLTATIYADLAHANKKANYIMASDMAEWEEIVLKYK